MRTLRSFLVCLIKQSTFTCCVWTSKKQK